MICTLDLSNEIDYITNQSKCQFEKCIFVQTNKNRFTQFVSYR